MKRIGRRFWTTLITLGATLVLLAAVASGLFQLAVQALPGYRADIERVVQQAAGRPIRIGEIGLTWRYYYPSLELQNVALMDAAGEVSELEAERVRIGFAIRRLVRGDLSPNRLELHGLALDISLVRDPEGQLRIEGLPEGMDVGAGDGAQSAMAGFEQLRLERCRLNVRDRRGGQDRLWSFGLVAAEMSEGLFGHDIEAEVTLPARIGDTAMITAALGGSWWLPETWAGTIDAELSGLSGGSWLETWLLPGATVEFSGAAAAMKLQLEDGALSQADLELRTGAIDGRRADHRANVEALNLALQLRPEGPLWIAEVQRLEVASQQSQWQSGAATLKWLSTMDTPHFELMVERLQLQDLAPWLAIVQGPQGLSALDGLTGNLQDVHLVADGAGSALRYQFRSRFSGIGIPAEGRAAGFSGVRGEVAADESGGRVLLPAQALRLELPGVLQSRFVPVEHFAAEAQWQQRESGLRIEVPAFQWAAAGTEGKGRMELEVPADRAQSPVLDLQADLAAGDVIQAKSMMPLVWSRNLRNWLDRSIVQASVPSGTLTIQGPLDHFPFDKHPGTFNLDLEVRDAVVAFQPDWPAIDQVDARLRFRGNRLDIDSRKARLAGNAVRKVSARFPNLSDGVLLIDGQIEGETSRFYDYLSNTPLRRTLSGLLENTTAKGPSVVNIQLKIPLDHVDRTEVAGTIDLNKVQLKYRALDEPFRNLEGTLHFGDAGTRAERLTAQFYELPLEAWITAESSSDSVLEAAFEWTLQADGSGASVLVPAWLRSTMIGTSLWRARLELGSAMNAPVQLTSNLQGVAVHFPAPLGKPAEVATPLRLDIVSTAANPLQLKVDYGSKLAGDLRFAYRRRELQLDAATLWLGQGEQVAATQPGLAIGGSVAELDITAWQSQLGKTGLQDQVGLLRSVDLHIGKAHWAPFTVHEARYQWAPEKNGWLLSMVGAGGSGEIRWQGKRNPQLQVRMHHLSADYVPDDEEVAAEAMDPTQWPVLDLEVQKVKLGAADLGQLVLTSERTPNGQKLSQLRMQGGIVTLRGNGTWQRRAGASTAQLDVDFQSSDIGSVLRAASYTPNLDAKQSKVRATLVWDAAPEGLDWTRARGDVVLGFENGQLRAVEPGAGRVLGLINFYALPRRLTLDFRDVLSSGLGFDTIDGTFNLADGQARSNDLRINGPSLRMDVRGRIGLTDRDYDQVVTVYPDVSAGVTLGAVLLGGPIAGVLALIAQEVLQKPLDQVTQLSYRLTGGWDNPQVTRQAAENRTPEVARPSGSPSKNP